MDPFLPVFVDNYSDKEFESCLALYKEKRWLQNEAGKNINHSDVYTLQYRSVLWGPAIVVLLFPFSKELPCVVQIEQGIPLCVKCSNL